MLKQLANNYKDFDHFMLISATGSCWSGGRIHHQIYVIQCCLDQVGSSEVKIPNGSGRVSFRSSRTQYIVMSNNLSTLIHINKQLCANMNYS